MNNAEFSAHIARLAHQVQEALEHGGPFTAWELKLRLKVSQSHLCMALGALMRSGAVHLTPDQMTYKVEPARRDPPPVPPSPPLAEADAALQG